MTARLKLKGTRIEREVQQLLEAIGYTVTRAGGSLGMWDLIAVHPTHTRLVQVKANRMPGSAEMEELESFRAPPGCSKEIWVRKDRVLEPVVRVL